MKFELLRVPSPPTLTMNLLTTCSDNSVGGDFDGNFDGDLI